MVVFGSDRTNHVVSSAKFGPEGRNQGCNSNSKLRLKGAT